MFSERRIVCFNNPDKPKNSSGSGLGKLVKAITNKSAYVRAKFGLNSNESAVPHNDEMAEAAKLEMASPLKSTIASIYYGTKSLALGALRMTAKTATDPFKHTWDAVGNIGYGTVNNIVGGTKYLVSTAIKMGTNVATGVVGTAMTPARIAADVLRLGARPPLILADKLAQWIGAPSRVANKYRLKVNKALYSKAKSREEAAPKSADKALGKLKVLPSARLKDAITKSGEFHTKYNDNFLKQTLYDHPKKI